MATSPVANEFVSPLKWAQFWSRPVDAAGLAAFRILLAAVLLASVVRFMAKGWVTALYVEPGFHFPYYGFQWVRAWPALGMWIHFVVMALAALALLVGLKARVAALVFFLLFTYAELIDKATYLNHYYLVSVLTALMTLLPISAEYSLDARWRGGAGARLVPRWAYLALMVQLGIVYLYAGVAKLNGDWLLRAEPISSWLMAMDERPLLSAVSASKPLAYAMSWFGALYDLSVAVLLAWSRTRRVAFIAALLFHILIAVLFPVGVFSWVMLASLTIFFSPSWPRPVLDRCSTLLARVLHFLPSSEHKSIRGQPHLPVAHHPENAVAHPLRDKGAVVMRTRTWPWLGSAGSLKLKSRGWSRVKAIAILAHFSVQLLVPLRSLLYPGEVNWTEEGFRFAWRVMVMEKTGAVEFEVETRDGRRFVPRPERELTPLQLRMMSTQPDMIQQYARHIACSYERRGEGNVVVRAHAFASLNGRAPQPLIDSHADLARSSVSLAPKRWIVPLQK